MLCILIIFCIFAWVIVPKNKQITPKNNIKNTFMKSFSLPFLAVYLSLLLFASCGNRPVERAAKNFLQAYYLDYDFGLARHLATEESQEHLNERVLIFEANPFARNEGFSSFEITGMDVKKTKAVVNYKADNTRRKLLLSKVNGQWLVDMSFDVANSGSEFSLSLNKPNTGGFASAESKPTRLGDDAPKR
jgi:hypothetical protein